MPSLVLWLVIKACADSDLSLLRRDICSFYTISYVYIGRHTHVAYLYIA